MIKNIAAFLLFALILTSGCESWAISWESDLAAALEKAKTEEMPVMADFYTDWCGWCKKLDKDVYTDVEVNRLAEKFICVKVNCGIDKGAFSKYKLRGYPTIIFFSSDGNAEETVVGYKSAQVFAGIMNNVLEKMPKSGPARQQVTDIPVAKERKVADVPVVKEKRAAGEFELSGIMGYKAIVNDKTVSVGDEVDDARVIAISKNGVRLKYKDKELALKI